jgi:uroporphyrinogen decarboxylase
MDDQIKRIMDALGDKPYIFNLGHGIHKDTPIAHVERAISLIRNT